MLGRCRWSNKESPAACLKTYELEVQNQLEEVGDAHPAWQERPGLIRSGLPCSECSALVRAKRALKNTMVIGKLCCECIAVVRATMLLFEHFVASALFSSEQTLH